MKDAKHSAERPAYVPALGFHSLTGLYDAVISRLLAEREWKALLVDRVAPRPGDAILDIGTGTGTLAIGIKEACPEAMVMGIDPDPAMLDRARAKMHQSGVDVRFEESYANRLPAGDGSVDKVVSSLVFHHLPRDIKAAALAEAKRVLKPGGRIYIADWGPPGEWRMRAAFFLVQLLDSFATTEDNRLGLLPVLMRDAGLTDVTETYRRRTVFGTLVFLEGRKA